jgi:hypothetical protein
MIASTLVGLALGYQVAMPVALADGRADWLDYAWQTIKLSTCRPSGTALVCPLYHQKWDWKRNQWVDIAISLDLARQSLNLRQTLTNNDIKDDDFVCVTALVLDATGTNVMVHHQNWHIAAKSVVTKDFAYRARRLQEAATIQIGSKQCRKGAGQDDAVFAAVQAGIAP